MSETFFTLTLPYIGEVVLSASSVVTLLGIITSLLASFIAIVISAISLRQTAHMTAEATRPYLVIYNDLVNGAGTPIQFLIIRNFGQTAAVIDSLEITPKVDVQYSHSLFEHMDGQIIAPGQSYSTAFKLKDFSTILTAKITYSSGRKTFHETFRISQKAISDHVHSKVAAEDSIHSQKIIAGCFQEYLRSKL